MTIGPAVSIVIPTHNKCRSLIRTLTSLERIRASDFEVIVVDDASDDDTQRWLDGYRPPYALERHRNGRRDGPARARNRGAGRATGDILLFLDDDMECGEDLIDAHLAHHAAGRDVAVVGRVLYHPDLRRTALTRYFDVQHLRHDSPFCLPARFATNNLSLSKSLFQRAGSFDEAFTCVGLEDVDLGMRLVGIPGCVLRYEPRAWAYHYHDQSLRDYMHKAETVGATNLAVLAAKFPEQLSKGAIGWLIASPMQDWTRAAVRAALSVPGLAFVLVPLAEIGPGDRLNRIMVKYLLASSMLRGYRRSLDAARHEARRRQQTGDAGGRIRTGTDLDRMAVEGKREA